MVYSNSHSPALPFYRGGHLLEGGRVDYDGLDLDEHSEGELRDLGIG